MVPLSPDSLLPQVCSVLESLEQEYKREEDWCGGADKLGPNSETDHVTPMISKHLEQKEAFLKVRSQPSGCGASVTGFAAPPEGPSEPVGRPDRQSRSCGHSSGPACLAAPLPWREIAVTLPQS